MRKRRRIKPDELQFATGRTHQEMFLLRPDAECNELILFWIAKAQEDFPVEIHEFQFMSNHYHLLGRDPDGNWADFMCHWEGNLARAVNRLRGRSGKFWADRYHVQPVLDDEAALELALYTLTNPVKDGLVARTEDWPGVSSHGHAVRGSDIVVRRFDHAAWQAAGAPADRRPFHTERRIVLTPLPGMEHLTPQERQERMRELLAAREADLTREREGRAVLGRRRVLDLDVFDRPDDPKRTREPLCHATQERRRREFRQIWREFNEAYSAAAALVRGGLATISRAVFPEGSYPPFLPRSWPEPG